MFNLSSNISYLSKETKLKLIFELLFLFLSKSIRVMLASLQNTEQNCAFVANYSKWPHLGPTKNVCPMALQVHSFH